MEQLCNTVFSLPIHTEIENSSQDFIIQKVKEFFKKLQNGQKKLFRTRKFIC